MSKYTGLALGLSLGLAGCGSSSPDAPGGASTSGVSSGAGSSSSTGGMVPGSIIATFGPVMVPSGKENTQCIVMNLKNAAALEIGQIHNQLSAGSHHLIVYRTSDTVEQLTPMDCQPFVDTLHPEKGSPLMISQKQDDLLTLPQGVAFSLKPDQFIRLEMHYINATPMPLEVKATTTFIPIAAEAFKDEADFLFIGDPDIKIAAHSKLTLGPIYLSLQANVGGANFFGITGHEHQWGTDVTVATTTAKTGTDTPVYDVPGWKWNEPKTVYADPPFQVPEGGGFRFTCEWNNESANPVGFGESANDEMCFFWAYYYPSKGAFVCAHTDQFPGGLDVCCPGNPLCAQLFP